MVAGNYEWLWVIWCVYVVTVGCEWLWVVTSSFGWWRVKIGAKEQIFKLLIDQKCRRYVLGVKLLSELLMMLYKKLT